MSTPTTPQDQKQAAIAWVERQLYWELALLQLRERKVDSLDNS